MLSIGSSSPILNSYFCCHTSFIKKQFLVPHLCILFQGATTTATPLFEAAVSCATPLQLLQGGHISFHIFHQAASSCSTLLQPLLISNQFLLHTFASSFIKQPFLTPNFCILFYQAAVSCSAFLHPLPGATSAATPFFQQAVSCSTPLHPLSVSHLCYTNKEPFLPSHLLK